jgi:hypothetical protein
MSLLDYFQLSLAEDLIVSLLALLAIDALVERLSLLEQINAKLEQLPRQENLNEHSQTARLVTAALNQSQHHSATPANNLTALHVSDHALKLKATGEKCEVRTPQVNRPYGVVVVEIQHDSGGMVFEIRQQSS